MRHRESFGAGMFVTFGVLAALAIAGAAAYYGIREKVWLDFRASDSENTAMAAQARKFAMPDLKRHGIVALSDDAGVIDDGGLKVLVGTGRDVQGKLKPLMVHFRVAQFGSDRQWKIESINIDGSEVYKARD